MSAPPPGWSLQRPFEKETTAAEWFESTDIPLMAVVRGITEIPARSLEVTANYACILATGKRCDGSDPTPEDLESGYYSLMPGGGKGGITRFNALVKQLPKAGQQNVRILQNWAKSKGYVKQPGTSGPQVWGVYDDVGNFSWRLKIKAQGSIRPGLQSGSQVPRFDARLGPGNYVNPLTGRTGGKSIGTHIPLY